MEKQEVMLEIRVDAEGALNFKLNELDETEVALTVDDTKTQKRPSGRSNDTCYVLLLGNTGSKREFIDVILQEPRFSESFGKLNTRSTVNCILSPPQQESQVRIRLERYVGQDKAYVHSFIRHRDPN